MTNESFRIPRRGNAGVAFLGVEIKDAVIVIGSVFAGLLCGSAFDMGNVGYLGMPIGGYFVNRLYIDWQAKTLPGAFRNFLFSKGLWGYTDSVRSQKTIFVGDGVGINTASGAVLDEFMSKAKRSPDHGNEYTE